jgi:hypothetical protein
MRPILPLTLAIAALACGCLCSSLELEGFEGNATQGDASANVTEIVNETNTTVVFVRNITNVGEAIFAWEPYTCNFTNRLTMVEYLKTQMWMDAGKYHAIVTNRRQERTHVLSDGETIYIWGETKYNTGAKYKISQIKGIAGKLEAAELAQKRTVALNTNYIDIIGAINVTCSPQNATNDTFTPPKKVRFEQGIGTYDNEYASRLEKFAKTS